MRIEVHWLVTANANPTWLDESRAWLQGPERDRHDRLLVPERGREFLLGRWLLRKTIATALGTTPAEIRLGEGPHGRPTLARPTPPLHPTFDFNASHGGGVVAVAIAHGGRIGIDLEDLARNLPARRIDRFLAPEENEALAALAPDSITTAFWRTWTLKEAVLKATGNGIAGGLGSVAIRLGDTPHVCRFDDCPSDRLRWQLREFRLRTEVQLAVAGFPDPGNFDPISLTIAEAC
ncbi:MAG: 4'-phosphopantetheinyl transferase superfamily protein [Planctomycetota bacterium]